MTKRLGWLGALTMIALATLSCTDGDAGAPGVTSDDAPAAGVTTATLELATEIGVRNARMPRPGLLTGGQPSVEQLDALTAAGVTRVISLRPADEEGAGWEEAYAAGFAYDFDRLEISGAESLTRENVDAFAALLQESEGEPTLLYCASGNRVGAMLALKAFWIDGETPEAALELALASGLTRLEGPVRELLGLTP
ncbi:MAG: sulfur transferase domain-containing protein [Gemmatimonadota bacterium]|nr:sulfur transferase domain-containing protein [Gemmatimonadota bacterium]